MNFASMKLALQRYGFDTTDPLSTWLNAALHNFESEFDWPFLEEGPVTIVLAAGARTIALPTDASKIITLRDETSLVKLKYYERHKFARQINDPSDPGLPEIYTLIGNTTLQFWRVPVTAINIGVLYQGLVPDMVADTDVPGITTIPFPTICHYPIVQMAAAIALQAENEEERAKTALEQYGQSLQGCMKKFGERELDEPTTVEDAQGYQTDMPIRGLGSW